MKGLFIKLSEENEYCSPEIMEKFYISFIRVILSELRANEKITLPKFGSFRIIEHKGRRIIGRRGKQAEVMNLPPIKNIKFTASKDLKYYIRNKI